MSASAAKYFSGKRLPAYGRELRNLRLRGLVPATQIIVGLDTWDYGKAFARVVIARDQDPAQLNFDFIAGLDCVLVRDPRITTLERRDAVLRELLENEPASLRCIELGLTIEWLWVKSRARGVEMPGYLK